MKKSIPKVRERESEASILGNDREREFPLTPDAVGYGKGLLSGFDVQYFLGSAVGYGKGLLAGSANRDLHSCGQ